MEKAAKTTFVRNIRTFNVDEIDTWCYDNNRKRNMNVSSQLECRLFTDGKEARYKT